MSTSTRKKIRSRLVALKDKFKEARKEFKKNPANVVHDVDETFLIELAHAMYSVVCTNSNSNSMELPDINYGENKSINVTFANANTVFDEITGNIDKIQVDNGEIN